VHACGNEFEAAARPNSFVHEYSSQKKRGTSAFRRQQKWI